MVCSRISVLLRLVVAAAPITATQSVNGSRHIIIPRGIDALQQGDEVFVIGSALAVEQLLRISGITFNQQLDRVIIVGASPIGIGLARVAGRKRHQC